MRCDTNFNRARPLVDHLVDTNLEHLVGAERPAAQDNTMVEVISGAVKKINSGTTLHIKHRKRLS